MGVEIKGFAALKSDLGKFPEKVAVTAQKKGLRKAAGRMRTYLRRAAPRDSGNLRKSIGIIRPRRGAPQNKLRVGLTTRFYYKTLEVRSARGAPLHPFFERAAERHSGDVMQIIVDETRKALYFEAGKLYAKSQRGKR